MLGSPISPVGSARASVEPTVASAVRKASQETGSSFELMMASAQMESGMKSNAKSSTSSAAGMFQFTEQTWLDTVRQHGAEHGMAKEASSIVDHDGKLTTADPTLRKKILALRSNLSVASTYAGDHLRDLSNKLSSSLGRAATSAEVYLGYFLGAHGAKQMISAPKNEVAANILPDAAKANESLFYSSNGTPLTAGQFLQKVQKRLNQAFADVGAGMSGSHTMVASTDTASSAQATTTVTAPAGASGQGSALLQTAKASSDQMALASLVEPLMKSEEDALTPKRHHASLNSEMPASTLASLQTTAAAT